MSNEWDCHEHELIYEGEKIKVWRDKVTPPGAKETTYNYVEQKDSVMMIAETGQGEWYLVRQYRYPIRQESWEFPAGSAEQGESPEEAARRELKQEIRMTSDNLTLLGVVSSNAALQTQKCSIFLAKDLRPASEKRDATEGDLIARTFSPEKVLEMVKAGQMHEASSLAALALLRLTR